MALADARAEAEIRRELSPNERLLWFAKPRQGIRFRVSDLYMIPFSLFWAGFAVFWELSVIRDGAPLFFMIWGIPFLVMGAYITVGRFILDAVLRRKTAYGLTDRRVLLVSGLWSRAVRMLDLAALPELSLVERSDRSGTIAFGAPASPRRRMMPGTPWPGVETPFAFEMIEEARDVYDRIRAAQEDRRTPGAA
jgi:hypothetical protein